MHGQDVEAVESVLDYRFKDRDILKRALTHASLVECRFESNERMEFLGDAVLGMVVCEYLFSHFDELLEGEMTKIKSRVVSRRVCAEISRELGLDRLIRIGKGLSSRGVIPSSVLAAVYESLIGAVFMDGGLEPARAFILSHMQHRIEHAARSGHQSNFKSVLQQAVQQQFDQTPQYLVLDEKGPDHAKCFEVCVEIGARRFSSCWGASKKEAEQQAALQAMLELGLADRDGDDEVTLRVIDESLSENGVELPGT